MSRPLGYFRNRVMIFDIEPGCLWALHEDQCLVLVDEDQDVRVKYLDNVNAFDSEPNPFPVKEEFAAFID